MNINKNTIIFFRSSAISAQKLGENEPDRAYRLKEESAKVGFDWPNKDGLWKNFFSELDEFQSAVTKGDQKKIHAEFGDLLFSLIDIGRWHGIKPNDALKNTNDVFTRRFQRVEQLASDEGKDVRNLSFPEYTAYWKRVKKEFGDVD